MKMPLALKMNPPPFKIILLLALMAALILSVIILSCVPPVSRDALTHHLAIPKLYLKQGGIYEIPHIVFSYYPMNIDLLYLIPLYYGNDIAPKFIHFSFALLTAWLIYRFLKKRTDSAYALLGALFFLSVPIIVKLSIAVYVDLGLAFFSTAAIIFIFKWMQDHFRLKHLIVSACWCGLALGTKYNGLVVLFLLTLFVPVIYVRMGCSQPAAQIRAAGYGLIFAAAALLIFSPWMIRNTLWKQNPIYPLYHNLLGPKPAPASAVLLDDADGNPVVKAHIHSAKNQKRVGRFAYRRIIYKEAWWQIALVPVRIFFSSRDNDPRLFDGKLTPFLFLLPLLTFIRSSERDPLQEAEKWVLLTFSVLFILIAFFTVEMRIRYLIPIVPPLVMLSILGLYRLNRLICSGYFPVAAKTAAVVVTAVAGAMLLVHAVYIVDQFDKVRPFDYLSGRVGRDAYIESHRGEYPVLQFANENLPADAVILGLFLGNRIYYSDRTMLTDTGLFFKAFKKVESLQLLSNGLRKKGLTHVIIRMDLFTDWVNNNFDETQKDRIQAFFRDRMKCLYFKNGYGLFAFEE